MTNPLFNREKPKPRLPHYGPRPGAPARRDVPRGPGSRHAPPGSTAANDSVPEVDGADVSLNGIAGGCHLLAAGPRALEHGAGGALQGKEGRG